MTPISSQEVSQSAEAKPAAQTRIHQLPNEMLSAILSFSESQELHTHNLVCKRWKVITSKPTFLQPYYWGQLAKRFHLQVGPANLKQAVCAYASDEKLAKVNSLLQRCFSKKDVHIQVEGVSESRKSMISSIIETVRSLCSVKLKAAHPFELNLRIRNFIRDNLKTEKFKSILVPVAQQLYQEARNEIEYFAPGWIHYSDKIRALQLLLDEGIPITIQLGQQMLDDYRHLYYINYRPAFEVFIPEINRIRQFSAEDPLYEFVINAIRYGNTHLLRFFIETFQVSDEQLLKIWLICDSQSMPRQIQEFLVDRCKSIDPARLNAILEEFQKSPVKALERAELSISYQFQQLGNFNFNFLRRIAEIRELIAPVKKKSNQNMAVG